MGKRKLITAIIAIAMVFTLAPIQADAAAKKVVKQVKAPKTVTMQAGSTKTVKIKVKATKGASKKFTARVANKKIASVTGKSKTIKITALKAGSTKITVTTKAKNKKKKKIKKVIKLTVKTVPVSGVKFASKKLEINTWDGGVKNATTVTPSNATNKKITYTSSNEMVASVDASGNIIPKSEGTILNTDSQTNVPSVSGIGTVTVTIKDASGNVKDIQTLMAEQPSTQSDDYGQSTIGLLEGTVVSNAVEGL